MTLLKKLNDKNIINCCTITLMTVVKVLHQLYALVRYNRNNIFNYNIFTDTIHTIIIKLPNRN